MQTNIFYNSKSIFIEYIDVIKSPYIQLLQKVIYNNRLEDIMDFSHIKDLSENELNEWYINRQFINPFQNLIKYDIAIEDLDKLLINQLSLSKNFIKDSQPLKFTYTLETMIRYNLVDNIYIYFFDYNEYIEKDIHELFNNKCKYVYGDIQKILKNIDNDSTFVLSDIYTIDTLIKYNKLKYSSILIPKEYRYNKKNINDYIIDLNELSSKYIFKYAFFNAL